MKKLFLAAVAVSVLSIASGAVMAEHHGDYKKGKMMEKVDTNGDGMVSKAEFMAKHEGKFAEMDADGDGNLSKEEMQSARGEMKDKMKDKKKEWKEKRQETTAE